MREFQAPFYRIFVLVITTLVFTSCSKSKGSGGDDDEPSSSSLAIREISADSRWVEDSIETDETLYYRAEVDSGEAYSIRWDDVSDGSGFYTADVSLRVEDTLGKDLYWKDFAEDGYSATRIVAKGSLIQWRIISTSEPDSKDESRKTFALRFEEWSSKLNSSSSGGNSERNSSSSVRFSSEGSSSSEGWGNGGKLDPSRTWKKVHLAYGDTLVFVAPVSIGEQYSLQLMDAYDFLSDEIVDEDYPSADVEVSLEVSGEYLIRNNGDGSTPFEFFPKANRARITVQPNFSKQDTGYFYIRLFGHEISKKDLKLNTKWLWDTIPLKGDAISHHVKVPSPGYYRFDVIDREYGPQYANGSVTYSTSIDSGVPIWENQHPIGTSYKPIVRSINSQADIEFDAVTEGSFGVRIQKLAKAYTYKSKADGEWYPEFIGSGDTVYIDVPISDSNRYSVQLNNIYGNGWSDCPFGFTYRFSNTGEWRADYFGSSTISPVISSSYYSRALLSPSPGSDTLHIRIAGTYAEGAYHKFSYKIAESPAMRNLPMPTNSDYTIYRQELYDTIVFHASVKAKKQYQIQWDDASEGSNAFDSDVKVWIKDGVSGSWVGFIQNGYNSMVKFTPTSDSLFVKVTGTTGSWAFRFREYAPRNIDVDLKDDWRRDSILQQDTIWYTLSSLTVGETYRIQWKDLSDSGNLANVELMPCNSNGTIPLPVYWGSSGSALNTLVAEETTMKIRVIGNTNLSFGAFWFRVSQRTGNIGTEVPVSKSWIKDTMETYDTLLFKFPIKEKGALYHIQLGENSGGVTLSTGNGFSQEALNKDLIEVVNADTLFVRIAATSPLLKASYSLRVYKIVPVEMNWNSSLEIWNEATIADNYDIVVFHVKNLNLGSYYYLRWDDGLDGTGSYSSPVKVSVRLMSNAASVMEPSLRGYNAPRLLYAYESEMLVVVSPYPFAGMFAISLKPN